MMGEKSSSWRLSEEQKEREESRGGIHAVCLVDQCHVCNLVINVWRVLYSDKVTVLTGFKSGRKSNKKGDLGELNAEDYL